MIKRIHTPLTREVVQTLHAGDQVLISGIIYTGRDAAHRRLVEMLDRQEPLPFEVADQIIYYVGPTPTPPGAVFGSGGPTTSGRMDAYAPRLLALGLRGMIGKGYRQKAVVDAMKAYDGVYFGAVGGAAAVIGASVKKCDIIAFEDLGPEAIRRLEVEDFPAVVVIDHEGNNLYELGRQAYLDSIKTD